MEKNIRLSLLTILCLFLIACSDEGSNKSEANKDHVWKEQTETIDKAKEVEGMLMDSAKNMRDAIENQE